LLHPDDFFEAMSEAELADWEQGVSTVLLNTTPAKRERGLSSPRAHR
jgi:hypothetical protein